MRLRATEYVTSPPASPKQQLSGRVIHAQARPPRCSERVPSPLLPPSRPLTHVSVAMGCPVTGSTWHLATPLLLSPYPLSISPLAGLVGGSVMKFHIFIQGATGSGGGLEHGQAEGDFSPGIQLQEGSGRFVAAGFGEKIYYTFVNYKNTG